MHNQMTGCELSVELHYNYMTDLITNTCFILFQTIHDTNKIIIGQLSAFMGENCNQLVLLGKYN